MQAVEQRIRKYLEERDWDHLRPVDVAKSIMIEGAELLEHFQWENLSLDDVKKNEKIMSGVKKELADVLIYACDMAVLLDLDIEKIIFDKLDQVEKKYPAKLIKSVTETDSGSGNDDLYWGIKAAHRKAEDT